VLSEHDKEWNSQIDEQDKAPTKGNILHPELKH